MINARAVRNDCNDCRLFCENEAARFIKTVFVRRVINDGIMRHCQDIKDIGGDVARRSVRTDYGALDVHRAHCARDNGGRGVASR